MPDEPSRAKGLCRWNLTSTTTSHIRRVPTAHPPSAVCVASCFAYRAHTARLLQPRTSASAYGVAVVLDIAAQSSILSFETNPALPLHISLIKYTQPNLIYIQVSSHPAQILKINSILEGRQFFQFPLFRHPSIASP